MRLLPPRKKRSVMTLQLTAMIDIFSLIVIFLIKGTVFGASDISVPEGMKLPESISKESAESAPRVTITSDHVNFSPFNEDIPLHLFRESSSADHQQLEARLKDYVAKLSPEARSSGVLLNVIADQKTPYRDVFDTIQLFRQSGFDSLLFVATGEAHP